MNGKRLHDAPANEKRAENVCTVFLQTKNERKTFAGCSCKRKMNGKRLHDVPANEKRAENVCTMFLQTKNKQSSIARPPCKRKSSLWIQLPMI
jgi:hypothetical protein